MTRLKKILWYSIWHDNRLIFVLYILRETLPYPSHPHIGRNVINWIIWPEMNGVRAFCSNQVAAAVNVIILCFNYQDLPKSLGFYNCVISYSMFANHLTPGLLCSMCINIGLQLTILSEVAKQCTSYVLSHYSTISLLSVMSRRASYYRNVTSGSNSVMIRREDESSQTYWCKFTQNKINMSFWAK